ncbi:hypothetical protein [Deinococcus sp. AJ005]|uniref:hypothetical protein n=1 Tax=Deinococcus sp. AJ005 TaxID=2652443 RepID=UPI00125CA833|nr:hypothetical protein [Deinococcus sp. AJ005]QFP76568.1 hypothetical protein DAAJ005_08955 [Deinococcus sp. AJ005]
MKLSSALLAPVMVAFLGACAPTTTQEQPLIDPVFTPGQVWEVAWEDGLKPSTVTIPVLYSNERGVVFYVGEDVKGVDNASASYSAGGEIRPHISINVTKAPYDQKRDCNGLINTPVEIGQTVQGVYAFQTGRGIYGDYVRTGDKAGLSNCTMKRIQ